ncbi:MAG: SURF1 family protein [Actinomycetota bacterium]
MDAQADWSFARSPKWIASHVGVVLLVVAMVIAGVWQINRYRDRADRNELIRDRAEMAAVDIGEIAPPAADPVLGEEQQFRRVTATGEFRDADSVLIRNRTFEGAPGFWVLTPLVNDEGWAVAVNRGWIPSSDIPDAPTGRVQIDGYVQPARTAEGFQVADPAEGRLDSLARPDVARLAQQLDYPLSPVVFQLAAEGFEDPSDGPDRAVPFLLSLPSLDGGPHASYAAQWFIFTTIALIGYPLVLRRVAGGRSSSAPEYDEE